MKDFDKELRAALGTKETPSAELNKKILSKGESKMKRVWVKGLKIAAGCAAAFVIGVTVLANAGANVAYAMQDIPVIGDLAKLVTFRTYEDESNNFAAKIEIPEIKEYTNAEKELNKDMQAYCESLIQTYESDKAESNGMGNYRLENRARVILDNDKYLTVRMDTTLIMASGTEFIRYYTIDKQADRLLKLEDLFEKGFDYKTYIYNEVVKQMKEKMAEDDSLTYFLPGDDTNDAFAFKSLPDDVQFYVNEAGKLVVSFDEYEVAPGYMGAQSFIIPLHE